MEGKHWQTYPDEDFPTLRGQFHCDVAIVGAGLTGVTLAWMLAKRGVSSVILEADTPGCGSTTACTGKVTAQLEDAYVRTRTFYGKEIAAAFAERATRAVHHIGELAVSHPKLWCQSQHVYLSALQEDQIPALEALYQLERGLGLHVQLEQDHGDCPLPTFGSVRLEKQELLSPMAWLYTLLHEAQGLGCRIFTHTPVQEVRPQLLITPKGALHAQIIVLCTGVPIGLKRLPLLALMEQHTLVEVQLTNAPTFQHSYLECREHGFTLRPLQDGALMVRDLGRTGTTALQKEANAFRQEIRRCFPDASIRKILHRQEVFSVDGLPLIGAIHPKDSHLLMASGYSGWGLVGSYMAAQLLSDNILGTESAEGGLFLPSRTFPGKWRAMLQGSLPEAGAMLGSMIRPFAPKCPHMGCRLRYNTESEHWECPCHGSSFSFMGAPRYAPAMHAAPITSKQRKRE